MQEHLVNLKLIILPGRHFNVNILRNQVFKKAIYILHLYRDDDLITAGSVFCVAESQVTILTYLKNAALSLFQRQLKTHDLGIKKSGFLEIVGF